MKSPTTIKIAGLVFIGVAAYLFYSTLANQKAQSQAQDHVQEALAQEIQNDLTLYRQKHNIYPSTIDELAPEFEPVTSRLPSTKTIYQYQVLANGADYRLCVTVYSTQVQKCVTSAALFTQ